MSAWSAALIPDPQYVLKSFRIRKLKGASISLRKNVNLKFASALNPDPEQGAKNVESSVNAVTGNTLNHMFNVFEKTNKPYI